MFNSIYGSHDPYSYGRGQASGSSPVVQDYEHYASDNRSASGKIVRVSASTMKALQQASDANHVAKRILCHGAGNQKQDIVSSSGESWARNELACQKYSAGVPADQLQRAQKFQGGNCPVFASVASAALQLQGVERPVTRVRARVSEETGQSHEYLLLGDRRALPEREVVVVDAWPTRPIACTLDQAILNDKQSGRQVRLTDLPNMSRYSEFTGANHGKKELKRINDIQPMSSEQVNKALRKKKLPQIGPDLVRHAIHDNGGQLFDVSTATNPGTQYTDGSTHPRSFG